MPKGVPQLPWHELINFVYTVSLKMEQWIVYKYAVLLGSPFPPLVAEGGGLC